MFSKATFLIIFDLAKTEPATGVKMEGAGGGGMGGEGEREKKASSLFPFLPYLFPRLPRKLPELVSKRCFH